MLLWPSGPALPEAGLDSYRLTQHQTFHLSRKTHARCLSEDLLNYWTHILEYGNLVKAFDVVPGGKDTEAERMILQSPWGSDNTRTAAYEQEERDNEGQYAKPAS